MSLADELKAIADRGPVPDWWLDEIQKTGKIRIWPVAQCSRCHRSIMNTQWNFDGMHANCAISAYCGTPHEATVKKRIRQVTGRDNNKDKWIRNQKVALSKLRRLLREKLQSAESRPAQTSQS